MLPSPAPDAPFLLEPDADSRLVVHCHIAYELAQASLCPPRLRSQPRATR